MTPALYASRQLLHSHHNLPCENRTSLYGISHHTRVQVSPSCARLENGKVASRSPYPGLRASKHRDAVSDFVHPVTIAFLMREFHKLPCCHVLARQQPASRHSFRGEEASSRHPNPYVATRPASLCDGMQ